MSTQRITNHDATQAVQAHAVTVVELSEKESGHALLEHFGIADFADTEPAELSLVSIPSDELRDQVAREARHSRYDDLALGALGSGLLA